MNITAIALNDLCFIKANKNTMNKLYRIVSRDERGRSIDFGLISPLNSFGAPMKTLAEKIPLTKEDNTLSIFVFSDKNKPLCSGRCTIKNKLNSPMKQTLTVILYDLGRERIATVRLCVILQEMENCKGRDPLENTKTSNPCINNKKVNNNYNNNPSENNIIWKKGNIINKVVKREYAAPEYICGKPKRISDTDDNKIKREQEIMKNNLDGYDFLKETPKNNRNYMNQENCNNVPSKLKYDEFIGIEENNIVEKKKCRNIEDKCVINKRKIQCSENCDSTSDKVVFIQNIDNSLHKYPNKNSGSGRINDYENQSISPGYISNGSRNTPIKTSPSRGSYYFTSQTDNYGSDVLTDVQIIIPGPARSSTMKKKEVVVSMGERTEYVVKDSMNEQDNYSISQINDNKTNIEPGNSNVEQALLKMFSEKMMELLHKNESSNRVPMKNDVKTNPGISQKQQQRQQRPQQTVGKIKERSQLQSAEDKTISSGDFELPPSQRSLLSKQSSIDNRNSLSNLPNLESNPQNITNQNTTIQKTENNGTNNQKIDPNIELIDNPEEELIRRSTKIDGADSREPSDNSRFPQNSISISKISIGRASNTPPLSEEHNDNIYDKDDPSENERAATPRGGLAGEDLYGLGDLKEGQIIIVDESNKSDNDNINNDNNNNNILRDRSNIVSIHTTGENINNRSIDGISKIVYSDDDDDDGTSESSVTFSFFGEDDDSFYKEYVKGYNQDDKN